MFRKAKSASPACDLERDMKALCRKRTMSTSVPLNNHVSRGMEKVAKSWIVKKAFASARGSYCFSYSRKRHGRVSPSSLILPILPLLEPHKYFTLLFIHATEWNSCSFTVFLNFPFCTNFKFTRSHTKQCKSDSESRTHASSYLSCSGLLVLKTPN